MAAEETQEIGREGVFQFKRWLESTTYLDLGWNAYKNPAMCEVSHMGGFKIFDLAGSLLTRPAKPVSVECKKYTSAGQQDKEYLELLAIAYGSILSRRQQNRSDEERQFIWATTHPFSVTRWSKLTKIETLRDAVLQNPKLAAGVDDPNKVQFDEDVGRLVMDRVWLLVWHEKQEQISLNSSEILKIWELLNRKEVEK